MVKKAPEPPSLRPFYHRGRKTFVPLTAEEVSRHGINPDSLTWQGLAERYQQGGISCYRITDKGRQTFAKQQAAAESGKAVAP